jgi:uncharacterized pyridoxamine 5'-phosphate oxidase family protein
VYETDDDVRRLQELIDRSHARMGPHMRTIVTPDRTLDARQLVTYLQGVKHVAFATVGARGEPRVAPVDALFVRGRFHVATGGAAARVRHLRRRPKVSLTHFVADEVAVVVHGTAALIGRDDPEAPGLERIYVDAYGSSPFGWADDVVLIRVEPETLYASAQHPDRFPTERAGERERPRSRPRLAAVPRRPR